MSGRSIPLLPAAPLVGNLLELRKDRLALLERVPRECGEVGGFRLGWRRVFIFNAPRHAAAILVEHAAAFDRGPMVARFARPLFGDSVATAPPAAHPRKRRFAARVLQALDSEEAAARAQALTSAQAATWAGRGTVDLRAELSSLTLSVLGRLLFGERWQARHAALGDALASGLRYASERLDDPLRLPLYWPTPRNLATARSLRALHDTVDELISAQRTATDGIPLARLLEGGVDSAPGEIELRDQFITLLVAGTDTLTASLSWALCLLSTKPDLQHKLATEARSPGSSSGSLLQVYQETLRLYPPLHSLGRKALEPLEIDGYQLPRGALVLICPYLLHRRAETFPDPARFDPERFAPGRPPLPPFSYLPFGAGARGCLGRELALLQAPRMLAAILRAVSLSPAVPDLLEPEVLMTLRPRRPLVQATAP
jgi:cytochrome P450